MSPDQLPVMVLTSMGTPFMGIAQAMQYAADFNRRGLAVLEEGVSVTVLPPPTRSGWDEGRCP